MDGPRNWPRGIDLIPVNDFSLYDQMLDMSALFGAVPDRDSWAETTSISTRCSPWPGGERETPAVPRST